MSTINNKLIEALKDIIKYIPAFKNSSDPTENIEGIAAYRRAKEAIAEAEQQEETTPKGSGCYSGGRISTGEEL